MKKIASELLVERLIDWGVDTVFGLPGDGINGIMEGLRRHQDRISRRSNYRPCPRGWGSPAGERGVVFAGHRGYCGDA